MEEKPTMYKIINKYRPEPARVVTPNPKSKTKQELIYSQKNVKRKYTNPSKSTIQYNSRNNNNKKKKPRKVT